MTARRREGHPFQDGNCQTWMLLAPAGEIKIVLPKAVTRAGIRPIFQFLWYEDPVCNVWIARSSSVTSSTPRLEKEQYNQGTLESTTNGLQATCSSRHCCLCICVYLVVAEARWIFLLQQLRGRTVAVSSLWAVQDNSHWYCARLSGREEHSCCITLGVTGGCGVNEYDILCWLEPLGALHNWRHNNCHPAVFGHGCENARACILTVKSVCFRTAWPELASNLFWQCADCRCQE